MKKIFIVIILSLASAFTIFGGSNVLAAQFGCVNDSRVCFFDTAAENLTDAAQNCAMTGFIAIPVTCAEFSAQGAPSAPAQTSPSTPAPAPADPTMVKLENPLSIGTSVGGIIKQVITTALGIIGALTLLMFVWGGFEWLTSAGNPEKVKAGTQTMVWAIIGVVLVFSSYLLLATFTNILTTGKP
jgi:hypothetical protein